MHGKTGAVTGAPRHLASVAAITFLLAFPSAAQAINCGVRVNPVNFGLYQSLSASPVDVTGQIRIICRARPGTFAVTIGPGISGDSTARTLVAAGTGSLYYNLYRDAARTQIWGDGTPPTFVVTGARTERGRPTTFNFPIYGRIFANQAPDAGLYTDNLVVTVLF